MYAEIPDEAHRPTSRRCRPSRGLRQHRPVQSGRLSACGRRRQQRGGRLCHPLPGDSGQGAHQLCRLQDHRPPHARPSCGHHPDADGRLLSASGDRSGFPLRRPLADRPLRVSRGPRLLCPWTERPGADEPCADGQSLGWRDEHPGSWPCRTDDQRPCGGPWCRGRPAETLVAAG